MSNRHTVMDSSIGELTLVADGTALTGLYFEGHWHPPRPDALGPRDDRGFEDVFQQLTDYLDGRRTTFDLEVEPHGDEFQATVWDRLRMIPWGQTVSYGSLADELGDRSLARRVGGAVARNPVSIVIPCHRVVGADGSLTGYAGGLARKAKLLDLEAPAARLF